MPAPAFSRDDLVQTAVSALRSCALADLNADDVDAVINKGAAAVQAYNGAFDPAAQTIDVLEFEELGETSSSKYTVRNSRYAPQGSLTGEITATQFESVDLVTGSNCVICQDQFWLPDWTSNLNSLLPLRRRLFVRNEWRAAFFHPAVTTAHINSALDITHCWSENWFHFLLEVCGVFANPDIQKLPENTPILYSNNVNLPQQLDALRFFAGDRARYLTSSGAWGCPKCDRLWSLDSVWCNSPYDTSKQTIRDTEFDGYHHHKSHLRIPELASDFYRKACPDEKSRGDKIFISRRNAKRPRCLNEADLEAVFTARGFKILCPEDFSFAQQASIFHHAGVVAGVSGAAFANIVFCQPGTKIICARDQNSDSCTFAQLAAGLGHEFLYIDGETQDASPIKDFSTFVVNLTDLNQF